LILKPLIGVLEVVKLLYHRHTPTVTFISVNTAVFNSYKVFLGSDLSSVSKSVWTGTNWFPSAVHSLLVSSLFCSHWSSCVKMQHKWDWWLDKSASHAECS